MGTKHTAEPWVLRKGHDPRFYPYEIVYYADKSDAPPIVAEVKTKEAAERIVACVNACEGMEKPSENIAELNQLVKDITEQWQNTIIERDVFRKALEDALEDYNRYINGEAANAEATFDMVKEVLEKHPK